MYYVERNMLMIEITKGDKVNISEKGLS